MRLWEAALCDYDELVGLDWSWLALDGAMTKAPLGGEKNRTNPTDRAKGGVKRSLLTESCGIPVGLEIEGANRHDMKLVAATLASVTPVVEDKRLCHMAQGCDQDLCLDAGYDYDEVREIAQAFGYTTHIRPRGEEVQAKQVGKKARRWVVERTHSWINRYRRLLVRWEKKSQNYLAMLHLACALITERVYRNHASLRSISRIMAR